MFNQITLADALDALKVIQDESVDMVVTDPPYKIVSGGCSETKNEAGGIFKKHFYSSHKEDVKKGKIFKHNDITFSEWLPEIYRVLKKGTHAYIMVNSRNLCELQQEAQKVGFVFQNLLIWNKGNATLNKYYMQQFECILLLSKRPHRKINDMGSSNLINIPNQIGNREHPTQKPYELFDIFINNSSNKGDMVLDPFCGRGTTAVSAFRNGRNFICIEKDEQYYKIAVENLNKVRGSVGLFA